MILPIRTLFNRAGLPGGGVPAMSLNPDGSIATAVTAGSLTDSSGAALSDSWTDQPSGGDGGSPAAPNEMVLDTGALQQKHGADVWRRAGRYESGFDRWRRMGKPTVACPRGMGAYSLPDGTPCDPTISGPACQDSTLRIVQAITAGAATAAGQLQPAYYPGYPTGPYAGQVTVSGSAGPGAWIFGLLIVGAVAWAVANR